MIQAMRGARITPPVEICWPHDRGVSHREQAVPGHEGTNLLVSIFTSQSSTGSAPAFHTHGGGMITGDRFRIEVVLDWVERFGGVSVSVEYRLTSKFPDSYPIH